MLTINYFVIWVFLLVLWSKFNFLAALGAVLLIFLTAVVTGFGTKAGEDLWSKVKQWCS